MNNHQSKPKYSLATRIKKKEEVDELLEQIENLLLGYDGADLDEEVRELFMEAVALEEKYDLSRIATREYIDFLWNQREYASVLPLAQKYKAACIRLKVGKYTTSDAALVLGNTYCELEQYAKARQEYQQAITLCLELVEADGLENYCSALATTCCKIGEACCKMDDFKVAELALTLAKELCYRMPEDDPQYLPILVDTLHFLATVYHITNRFKKAEATYKQAIQSCEELAEESPVYLPVQADIYRHLGMLYRECNHPADADAAYKTAEELMDEFLTMTE